MAKKTATEPTLLSIDLGNAFSNLKADHNVSEDWRSIIGLVGNSNQMRNLPFNDSLKLDGSWYVVGDSARTHAANTIEDYPTKDRYTSTWYKRLFSFALLKAYGQRLNEGPFYPKIVSSIPASEYKIKERASAIQAFLKGNYYLETIEGTHLQVCVDHLLIIPEGAGSFMEASSVDSRCHTGTWIVLDIGYLTGDIVVFRSGNYVSDKSASDDTIGVRKIAEAIADYVRGNGGPSLDASIYDPYIDQDCIEISGTTYSIANVRQQTLFNLKERVNRFLTKAGNGENVAGYIITGGGADRYEQLLETRLPVIKLPNSRRANVEGGYEYLVE